MILVVSPIVILGGVCIIFGVTMTLVPNKSKNVSIFECEKCDLDICKQVRLSSNKVEKQTAVVKCNGNNHNSKLRYNYSGHMGCADLNLLELGNKVCKYGCLGLGSCVEVCPQNAIKIIDGLAVINNKKCTACKKCIIVCPKSLIKIEPANPVYQVRCNSKERGTKVKSLCNVGCNGCEICVKWCKFDAIKIIDNLAYIDTKSCTSCGSCASKCPTKAINNLILYK
ncbi:MAG: hypothetical protein ATN36_06960 [Epulopiscium sp. Nele67-Bin005]|nr:MAG: hypothetical protein ATN36_06960 [Epulopiscium sp. Nele67-Bin005]